MNITINARLFETPHIRVEHPLPKLVCPCGSKWYRDELGEAKMIDHDLHHVYHQGLALKPKETS